jgi:hypothetical protein
LQKTRTYYKNVVLLNEEFLQGNGVPLLDGEELWLLPCWSGGAWMPPFADGTGSSDSFTGPLKNGLNLIMVFGCDYTLGRWGQLRRFLD